MSASPLRLFTTAAATALLLGALGLGWYVLHFGLTDHASTTRLERDVRQLVAERTRQVQSLAQRVSRDNALIEAADANPDTLGTLFAHLQVERGRTAEFDRVSITVYVPTVSGGDYRVLAWSDGAAEAVNATRLSGPSALFVSPGTGGLLLVFVQPIEAHGRRIGVAAAETVLAPAAPIGAAPAHQVDTAYGPVTLEQAFDRGAGTVADEAGAFLIASASDEPLLQVRYSPPELSTRRRAALRQVVAVAALPFVVLVLLLTGRLLARRASAHGPASYLAWSGLTAALIGVSAAALAQLGRTLGARDVLDDMLIALTALAAATLLPVSMWWRPGRRRSARAAPVRFIIEQALAGGAVAALLLLLILTSRDRIAAASLAAWEFPLFPLDPGGLASLVSRLLLQLALCWAMATVLAALTSRWRVSWRTPRTSLVAAILWLAPAAVTLVSMRGLPATPPAIWAPVAGAIALFALVATSLRRYYRRTTQAMRLLLLFGALFLPTLALYPMAAFFADATTRQLIETEYSPVMAELPQRARAELARAQADIDQMRNLNALIDSARANPLRSQDAFTVWRETNLALTRVTSDVELYAPDRSLVSRFALNIPEYTYNASVQKWQGSGCDWHTFDEPRRLGTEDRRVFRAERGLCDMNGRSVGAVVVHVVLDYQALPFITSANPYADVLPSSDRPSAASRLADLQVVVYGWSLYPLSPSGRIAWPITAEVFTRLNRSRVPFWETLAAVDRQYRVHFTSDRGGIYAIGYPESSVFEHATRLAEAAALTGALFVVFLIGAAIYGPFAGRREAPLRVLFDEIRTSFYRKLFLFFVFAAIVPVLMFAIAFRGYMESKFGADVASEATSVVTVARQMLEELAAAEQRSDQAPTVPTDDVMVWIGQVIHQHVNLFEGSQLRATSQRDLFESGLLPMRTPARAYREIALERLPAVVIDDRLGTFQYQVAAAPVPTYGRDSVLSVPLALRQREIEQQIADLDRGVLVGAVVVVLFAAGLGASVAGRISDPVARLTRATRQIAAGQLDVRIVADTADELRRLVDDFNSMAATLVAQRAALARTNQLKAWNEMARQVAHEIKNPLTPIQLSTEHLQRVHEDAGRPLGAVFDQCASTVLKQVRLLRQIAAEFSNFAGEPTPRPTNVNVRELVEEVVAPYRMPLEVRIGIEVTHPAQPIVLRVDRTLVARALTNVIENALHAMPAGGTLRVSSDGARGLQTPGSMVTITITDTGVGMDAEAVRRAFEPYFSTRTAGSGLGLANAKRNIELCGGTIVLTSEPGRGTVVTVTLPAASPSAGPATG